MANDYNYEVMMYLAKLFSKLTKSSNAYEYIEKNYPFDDSSASQAFKIIEKDFKNILFEHEKEYEKLIVEEFLSLIKGIVPDKSVDEVTYKISKEFNKYYEKGDIEGFVNILKKYETELKKLLEKKEELILIEEKDDKNYKKEILELLKVEDELKRSKNELISIIEIFIDNLKDFFETDELLKQKIRNLKEDLKNLETLENIERFKQEVKDLFVKLGVIERILEEEKKELKNIILLLAENLKEFIGSSDEYAKNLDILIKKIQETDDILEIKKIKTTILKTTIIIKEKTNQLKEKLYKADEMLKLAQEKMKKLEREMAKAKEKALYDGLTGVYNRAVFNDRIIKEVKKAKREKRKLSFLMIDIDNFKYINDTYGHQTGDMVLKILANQIKKVMRDFDFLARYGGEEFAVILTDTGIEIAKKVADRIRKKIENTKILYKKEKVPVTVSIGCTELKEDDNDKTLIERADRALYEAKNSGKNKVVVK